MVQVSGLMHSWDVREGVTGTGHRMIIYTSGTSGWHVSNKHNINCRILAYKLFLRFYLHLSYGKVSLIQSVSVEALSNLTPYQKDNLQVINQWTCCWKLLNTVLTTMGCHTMKCLFSSLLLVNKNILCVRLDKIDSGASLSCLARIIKCAVR